MKIWLMTVSLFLAFNSAIGQEAKTACTRAVNQTSGSMYMKCGAGGIVVQVGRFEQHSCCSVEPQTPAEIHYASSNTSDTQWTSGLFFDCEHRSNFAETTAIYNLGGSSADPFVKAVVCLHTHEELDEIND